MTDDKATLKWWMDDEEEPSAARHTTYGRQRNNPGFHLKSSRKVMAVLVKCALMIGTERYLV